MYCYEISANLQTDIFSKNYQKNIYFLGKTVHYIENVEAIDNWYFFSHNQFFRLTEFKDHIQGKIYISDEIIPDFNLKEYDNGYDKIFTLPFKEEQIIQSTGITDDIKKKIQNYSEGFFYSSEIYNINSNLNNFLIITDGKVEIDDCTLPIGIICYVPRERVSENEFFSEIKIPVISRTLDDKIEEYRKNADETIVDGTIAKRLEDFIK